MRTEPVKLHKNARNLVGQRFGRLLVLAPARRRLNARGHSQIVWECQCDCGVLHETTTHKLHTGSTKSCGCLLLDTRGACCVTHGEASKKTRTAEYRAWSNIKTRCHNPDNPAYEKYGARGIVVCERWRDSFENFLADMGRRPSARHSIDRWPDNDGNYEPDNCRWANKSQQALNRRTTRWLTLNGERRCLKDWCDVYGIKYNCVIQRVRMLGWSIERALMTPKIIGKPSGRRNHQLRGGQAPP